MSLHLGLYVILSVLHPVSFDSMMKITGNIVLDRSLVVVKVAVVTIYHGYNLWTLLWRQLMIVVFVLGLAIKASLFINPK